MNFTDLNLIQPIINAVSEIGYLHPTPIQHKVIPLILDKKDVLGCAQTGTGKTAAFAIPVLQLLSARKTLGKPRALILTPTRELALQIDKNFGSYNKYLHLKHIAIFGGVPQGKQVAALRSGIDVLIATPGRLLDLMAQGHADISAVEIFILDEADHMLDMGFVRDVKKIITKIPAKRQTLLFSATMPGEIKALANEILRQPVEVKVAPVSSTATGIQQSVYFVEKSEKTALLVSILNQDAVSRSLVFTRTKRGADKLAKNLERSGIYAAAIHGNKSQNAREKAIEDFRSSRLRVLVATDIAARGIDIEHLPSVINYELPNVPETYVHRIGRTGRANAVGAAISFCDSSEKADLKNIQKLIGFNMPVLKQTATNVKQPVVNEQQHAANVKQPVVNVKQPVANVKQPAVKAKQPVANVKRYAKQRSFKARQQQ